MKDSRFFNEAKRAKESAAAKASELAEQASGRAEDLKAKAADLKDQIADQTAELREAGLKILNESLEDFNNALPVLREAGYVVEGVTIGLGVPPKIVASFSGGSGVSDEKVQEILDQHAERKLTVMLVKSVHHATQLQSKLSVKGMRPKGLSVEVGLIPQVAVRFGPVEEAAQENEVAGGAGSRPSLPG